MSDHDIDTDACLDAWDHAAPFAAAAAAPFGGLASAAAELSMHGLGHLDCNEMIGPPAPYVDAKLGYDPATDAAPTFDPAQLDHDAAASSHHNDVGGFDYDAASHAAGGGFDYDAASQSSGGSFDYDAAAGGGGGGGDAGSGSDAGAASE